MTTDTITSSPAQTVDSAPSETASTAAQETANPPKSYKLKINGQEKDYQEQDLIRFAQKGLAADSKFDEVAKARKEVESFYDNLKSDPKKALRDIASKTGLSIQEVAEQLLLDDIQASMKPELTPEQKRIQELESELAQKQEAEEAQAKTKAEREFLQKKNEAVDHYLNEIQTALDTVGFLKGDSPQAEQVRDMAVADAARYLKKAYEAGYEATTADIADYVKQSYQSRISQLLMATDGDLESLLPKEFVRRVGKYFTQKVKGSTGAEFTQTSVPQAPKPTESKPLKYSELKRRGLA